MTEEFLMRLGSIDFINSLPVDLGLRSGAVASDIQMVRGVPAALNEKILNNELEISAVSALWYAEHQTRFVLLPDLSISSESGVMSVLLFSQLFYLGHPFVMHRGQRIFADITGVKDRL